MSSNYQTIAALIEETTGQKGWVTGALVKVAGDGNAGLLLDRVVWWSDKSSRQDGFFWKSAQEWELELGFSYATLTTAAKRLVNAGLITRMVKKANGIPTTHYRAEMEVIRQAIIEEYRNSGYAKLDNPEIRESSISDNTNPEIEESQKSLEIQESAISITELTITNSITNDDEESACAQIFKLYEQNIGTISPITAQEMTSPEYLKIPHSWWQEAFSIATANNARKWSYIRSVLDRSIAAGQSPKLLGPPKQGKNGASDGHNSSYSRQSKTPKRSTLDEQPTFDPYTDRELPPVGSRG